MTANDTQAWPSELRLHKDRKTLTVTFAAASASICRPNICA